VREEDAAQITYRGGTYLGMYQGSLVQGAVLFHSGKECVLPERWFCGAAGAEQRSHATGRETAEKGVLLHESAYETVSTATA
jgi:hypothetical protein